MDNRRIIALSFLIVALALGYYFVIYTPQKNQEQLDLQKQQFDLKQQQIQQQADIQKQQEEAAAQKATDNKTSLDTCLTNA